MRPLLIAHRGDTINYPENTFESFASAFKKGANGIELDLQYERGQLIVVHDYLYDKKSKYPLLSDILKSFSGKGRFEIEIKCFNTNFLSPLQALLNKYLNADIELTSSIFPLFSYLRNAFPTVSLGVIFHDKEFEGWMTPGLIETKIIRMTKLCKANVPHIPFSVLSKKLVDACHNADLKVHSHIYKSALADQMKIYKQFRKWEVDQCTFDDMSSRRFFDKLF